MQTIFAQHARMPQGWVTDLRLTIEAGKIATLEPGAAVQPQDHRVGALVPALANLHSHSFQRAMAGMTETRVSGRDSFWSWRKLMYQFVDHLTPEQYEAIAALVFMEMLEAGYASVGEFHYVHHQPGGQPYEVLGELSHRVFAAADLTGIGLTHLPVLYTYGGAGQAPLGGGQQRFGNDVTRYANLLSDCRTTARELLPMDARVGIAPHSLRASAPDELAEVLTLRAESPVHIHIAEQPQEVADIGGWLGERPVQWLLNNCAVDKDWCLIHATHMTEQETHDLARSGAVAGLCPITEANLGDGPFNGALFQNNGGRFGVGSDSNIRISLSEELRLLEYSQRLRDLARNVMVPEEGSVGAALYLGAACGGAQALGRNAGRLEVGALADLMAFDTTDVTLCALRPDQFLDGLCFAADDSVVRDVWSAGRHVVTGGRHANREQIITRYTSAVAALLSAL
ncbi:formimidoylglutamate deiminase [Phaeobacter inhibens]|uniref:formimidoylglutamate deiminase n=1 Tax=Phaeobacter inhibens TaxID=221822 RepID=UPI000160DF00|nr:formimidoylglutamate deiminase [Phaeobacter inhibens]AFO89412.1 putative formiminoglutamate deiminase [Phaeobacter inhibens 2.10]AXT44108.1 formimidoylglutamate deiminase [Phaeobacter inhibens]